MNNYFPNLTKTIFYWRVSDKGAAAAALMARPLAVAGFPPLVSRIGLPPLAPIFGHVLLSQLQPNLLLHALHLSLATNATTLSQPQ